nr:MAG TPA: hypothetical protein [Caudoviricetes sp.]
MTFFNRMTVPNFTPKTIRHTYAENQSNLYE